MKLPIEPFIIDLIVMCTGLVVAVAAVILQWNHFKKNNPLCQKGDPAHVSAYNRWKAVYWREVRATFALALISLLMLAFIVIFRDTINVATLVSIGFWLGMFFYNLWVAQWYAWRIKTKRRR